MNRAKVLFRRCVGIKIQLMHRLLLGQVEQADVEVIPLAVINFAEDSHQFPTAGYVCNNTGAWLCRSATELQVGNVYTSVMHLVWQSDTEAHAVLKSRVRTAVGVVGC